LIVNQYQTAHDVAVAKSLDSPTSAKQNDALVNICQKDREIRREPFVSQIEERESANAVR
jgi:hypothetical protein